MTSENEKLIFTKEFTRQEPIPEAGILRATELLENGRLHRYNTTVGEESEVALLEKEFADYMGTKYCTALSSCGSALYVALKSAGVKPKDLVLCNAFTLAPVPGAIENAGAIPVFIEITKDYLIDLADLEKRASATGAKYLMLSHMRGHIADMDAVAALCRKYNITMIEDCAHTAGALWNGKKVGTFGLASCFSTQTYKHINSGEGGLIASNDPDLIAKAILYSGSYMLYERHGARPEMEVFEKYKKHIPNFSLRMTNLAAALIRPQLALLDEQCKRWNARHDLILELLADTPGIYLPRRDPLEYYVGSSFQFTLVGFTKEQVEKFLEQTANRGVEVKWFGWKEPNGFTSRYSSWLYVEDLPPLEQTDKILDGLCDFRVPLTFDLDDCRLIAKIIKQVAESFIA